MKFELGVLSRSASASCFFYTHAETSAHSNTVLFAIYAGACAINFWPIMGWLEKKKHFSWVLHFPVFLLIAYKIWTPHIDVQFLGISYLCLRLWKFNIELSNGKFERPSAANYFGFVFFFPTFTVGPINSYLSVYERKAVDAQVVYESALRLLVGLGKFFVLAPICTRLDFDNLWHDGYLHGSTDFVVSCVAYFLYLYCNFSGFIDMMIVIARLCGIELPENFDRPLTSRNIKEFWNRWHITLSMLVRDTIFTPFSKILVRWLGPKNLNFAVGISIFVTFVIVGLWHGNGSNFLLFGAWHGFGLAVNHAYTVWLKKRMGKRFRVYESWSTLRYASVVFTFLYVSFSFFFFENSPAEMQAHINILKRFYGH